MTSELRLLPFPKNDIQDLPRALRSLAEGIEAGEFGDAHNLIWVIDCGSGRIELGLLGKSASPGAEGYFLLAQGMRRLEDAI